MRMARKRRATKAHASYLDEYLAAVHASRVCCKVKRCVPICIWGVDVNVLAVFTNQHFYDLVVPSSRC